MSNMGYCRFQNTLSALQDCYDNIEDELEKDSSEWKARKELIELCEEIAVDYLYERED